MSSAAYSAGMIMRLFLFSHFAQMMNGNRQWCHRRRQQQRPATSTATATVRRRAGRPCCPCEPCCYPPTPAHPHQLGTDYCAIRRPPTYISAKAVNHPKSFCQANPSQENEDMPHWRCSTCPLRDLLCSGPAALASPWPTITSRLAPSAPRGSLPDDNSIRGAAAQLQPPCRAALPQPRGDGLADRSIGSLIVPTRAAAAWQPLMWHTMTVQQTEEDGRPSGPSIPLLACNALPLPNGDIQSQRRP